MKTHERKKQTNKNKNKTKQNKPAVQLNGGLALFVVLFIFLSFLTYKSEASLHLHGCVLSNLVHGLDAASHHDVGDGRGDED